MVTSRSTGSVDRQLCASTHQATRRGLREMVVACARMRRQLRAMRVCVCVFGGCCHDVHVQKRQTACTVSHSRTYANVRILNNNLINSAKLLHVRPGTAGTIRTHRGQRTRTRMCVRVYYASNYDMRCGISIKIPQAAHRAPVSNARHTCARPFGSISALHRGLTPAYESRGACAVRAGAQVPVCANL